MARLEGRKGRLLGLLPVHWAMIGIIAMALVYGGLALSQGAAVSYASVREALVSARNVQVIGFPHHTNKGSYDALGNWTFDMQGEDGTVMPVVFAKAKPANFEEATEIVAYGKYDPAAQHFVADSMLVKCPTKYQEQAEAAASGR